MPTPKKEKATTKSVAKKKKKDTNRLKRKGYELYFLNPNTDQQLITDLRNTGKVISEATVVAVTPDDKVDEVVVIVRD